MANKYAGFIARYKLPLYNASVCVGVGVGGPVFEAKAISDFAQARPFCDVIGCCSNTGFTHYAYTFSAIRT